MPFRQELRALLRLALPLAAAQAGNQLMALVDIAVLGRVGARELAGAGLANAFFFATSVLGIGIVFGIDPMISQAVGAGDRVGARRILWQGIWLALIVTAGLSVPLYCVPWVLPHLGIAPELHAPTTTFLVIRGASMAPLLVYLVLRAYLQAHSITRPMIVSTVVCNVFNLVVDIWLVFGGLGVPPMGVAGAAIATVLGSLIQVGILAAAVRKIEVPPCDVEKLHRFDGGEVRRAFKVGLPVGLQQGAEIGIFALAGVLAARIGTLDLAAHQLVISLASFTYTMSLGIAAAGSVRVGLGVGARDQHGARTAGYVAFLVGAGLMAIPAVLFAVFPRALARLVSNQPHVIAAAMPLFFVAAFFQLSDGIQATGAGVLRGAGDTRYAFVANLVGHWVIGFPVALYLGFTHRMGIVGIWWGLCAGLTIVAALLFIRFRRIVSRPIVRLADQ